MALERGKNTMSGGTPNDSAQTNGDRRVDWTAAPDEHRTGPSLSRRHAQRETTNSGVSSAERLLRRVGEWRAMQPHRS